MAPPFNSASSSRCAASGSRARGGQASENVSDIDTCFGCGPDAGMHGDQLGEPRTFFAINHTKHFRRKNLYWLTSITSRL
jgi:hypothetical protein